MWFEILPSMAAVAGLLGVPALAIAGIHKLVYGNFYQRELQDQNQRALYLRDERLSGCGYKYVGLENIPDEGASL